MLELISEAQATGVRLAAACYMLGISARTIERWRAEPDIGDRCCGPQRRPSNALTPAEEAQVVTVLTSARYAGLSPKQLVPHSAIRYVTPNQRHARLEHDIWRGDTSYISERANAIQNAGPAPLATGSQSDTSFSTRRRHLPRR